MPVDPADWPELDLEKLLRRLVAEGVDFVVIGGIAAVIHGSPRVTRDLDICFAPDGANLEALGAALATQLTTLPPPAGRSALFAKKLDLASVAAQIITLYDRILLNQGRPTVCVESLE